MAEDRSADGVTIESKDEYKLEKVKPTLYIALGGTGMEVCLRLRRRILNKFWGSPDAPVRISGLSEFPLAQFFQIDLDQGANTESNRSLKTDLLSESVKFTEEERLVENFDLGKYTRSRDNLEMYPHIEEWFPLTPEKVTELKIDPSKGAGQIRAISRLYFFDKYHQIRDRVRQKLQALQANVSNSPAVRRLGLDIESRVRVVVVGSTAGGTGSGGFLDLGFLCRWQVKQVVGGGATVDLALVLPSGFNKAGKERTEANTYAALMELETCMTEPNRFVSRWDRNEKGLELENKPYDDVFLLDTANLALKQTSEINDLYEMAASALFEDFASADFANRKRSTAVNQQKFKAVAYEAPVPSRRYGEMSLLFSKGYSSFGFAEIDTQVDMRRNLRLDRQVEVLLKAYFGIAQADVSSNRATDQERDEFLKDNVFLASVNFTDLPQFGSDVELKYAVGEFWDYELTDRLLRDTSERGLLSAVEEKVSGLFETIRQESDKDQWQPKIEQTRKQLDRDNIRGIDTGADTNEDRIEQRMRQLLGQLTARDAVSERLYIRLDDKDRGGLDYTLSLIEQMKDRLENDQTGLIKALQQNGLRYREIGEALRGPELDRLMDNLRQTRGFFGKRAQAETVLGHVKEATKGYLQFHLRAVAADQAAQLLQEFSVWLGTKEGVDANGSPIWRGIAGEVQAGRNAVTKLLRDLDASVAEMEQAKKRGHPTYLVVNADVGPEPELASGAKARAWADEAFKDFGGSRALFERLKSEDGPKELIHLLRRKVLREMPQGAGGQGKGENPLFIALRAHKNRGQLFTDLLSLAMPWVNADLDRDFKITPAQYTCLIGVDGAERFKAEFLAELRKVVPAQSKITEEQLNVFESGVPGRLMCYTELSGLALPSLKLLETWRTSYRAETKKIPCHTHRDKTWFVHPIQRSAPELNALADDFKLFLQAVALGVLKRWNEDEGVYKVEVKKHVHHSIGDERAVRQDGFEEGMELKAIRNQVADRTEKLTSPYQGAALAALYGYYAQEVYRPRTIRDENKKDKTVKGFASAVAEELSNEANDQFVSTARAELDCESIVDDLRGKIARWTDEIGLSTNDIYVSEVGVAPEAKRVLKSVFFAPEGLEGLLGFKGQRPDLAIPPVPPSPLGSIPPDPPPPPTPSYHMTVGGQAYGPYTFAQLKQLVPTGQLTAQSQLWREGMAGWQPAGQLLELAGLFGSPVPPGTPPVMPPLPPKV